MARYSLYYVTNRGHEGKKRFQPDRYGSGFSHDGAENLRFGRVTLNAERSEVKALLEEPTPAGPGDGSALAGYFKDRLVDGHGRVRAFRESLQRNTPEEQQAAKRLGSQEMFGKLREAMTQGRDVLIYIHGYNVSWEDAVGSALALQSMLNRKHVRFAPEGCPAPGDVLVVLFTWPSDGSLLPWVAYRSDRSEAAPSGSALGRALLRLRDYLVRLPKAEHCHQDLNLLAHSMGNFVLENALLRARDHVGGGQLPRMLDQSFLCAADVDDDVLEPGKALGNLPELCNEVTVFTNRGDLALRVSDLTKGHPDRLGAGGVARPGELHHKIQQIDCSELLAGLHGSEHGYYLDGRVNEDIRLSLDGMGQNAPGRDRRPGRAANLWRMT